MNFTIPQSCLVCNQNSQSSLCEYCMQDLSLFDVGKYQHNLLYMPNVAKGLPQVDFPQVLALADYQWPLSKLLTGLKFSQHLPNAYALAALFVKHCLTCAPNLPQVVVPMPLHKNRYAYRKFNQSIELAKTICKLSQLKLDTSIIKRPKSTSAQTHLTAVQRRSNLRQAFEINKTALERLKTYEHIAIFDDVITTGSTMNCAYRCLNKHNPRLKIDVWSICLTLAH